MELYDKFQIISDRILDTINIARFCKKYDKTLPQSVKNALSQSYVLNIALLFDEKNIQGVILRDLIPDILIDQYRRVKESLRANDLKVIRNKFIAHIDSGIFSIDSKDSQLIKSALEQSTYVETSALSDLFKLLLDSAAYYKIALNYHNPDSNNP